MKWPTAQIRAEPGDQFRTAPLWGLGLRLFFLHDGRTTDLVQTIEDHYFSTNRTPAPGQAGCPISRAFFARRVYA